MLLAELGSLQGRRAAGQHQRAAALALQPLLLHRRPAAVGAELLMLLAPHGPLATLGLAPAAGVGAHAHADLVQPVDDETQPLHWPLLLLQAALLLPAPLVLLLLTVPATLAACRRRCSWWRSGAGPSGLLLAAADAAGVRAVLVVQVRCAAHAAAQAGVHERLRRLHLKVGQAAGRGRRGRQAEASGRVGQSLAAWQYWWQQMQMLLGWHQPHHS